MTPDESREYFDDGAYSVALGMRVGLSGGEILTGRRGMLAAVEERRSGGLVVLYEGNVSSRLVLRRNDR